AQFVDAPLPVAQLLFGVSVVQREHGRGMLRFHEPLARLAAHALRRRVGSDEFRMVRLEPLELVHQFVEVGIRKFRIIQHVIAIFVVPNLLAQSFDFLLDFLIWGGAGHNWGIIVARQYPVASIRLPVTPTATETKRRRWQWSTAWFYWVLVTGNWLLPFRFPNPSAAQRAATHTRRRLGHPFQQFFQHDCVVMLNVSR